MSPAFPDGHFYSPVVNLDEALIDQQRIWAPGKMPQGIDLNAQGHEHLLRTVFPAMLEEFDYPAEGGPDTKPERFHDCNGLFEKHDARVAFCLVRTIKPRRIVEVGSGYSTLLMSDINDRFFNGGIKITSIEPYPHAFLTSMAEDGRIELITRRAQEVESSIFSTLQENDILFIDSSHVSKTGSDVNRLILEVLPSLAPGVIVHFHDVFMPSDYPSSWVIDDGRSWNEQYLLQAFLAFNSKFSILYGSAIADVLHVGALSSWLGDHPPPGGSLWIRRNS